jgi:hypothetical protein
LTSQQNIFESAISHPMDELGVITEETKLKEQLLEQKGVTV